MIDQYDVLAIVGILCLLTAIYFGLGMVWALAALGIICLIVSVIGALGR